VYEVTEQESLLAAKFVHRVRQHLLGLTMDMGGYMITDVSRSSSERCSILLKEAFVASFKGKDKDFMSQFVETQMFTEYSDLFAIQP